MAGKKSPWDMGEHKPTKQDTIAYHWCLKNDIKISPLAKAEGSWWLDIENKGIVNRSPKTFMKTVIWEKMYEYYKYYYDKYEK